MPIRKYQVTLSDGKNYIAEWDGVGEPTAEDFESAVATPPSSTPSITPPSLFGRGLDVVGRIGNTITRAGSAVSGIAKEGVEAYQQSQPLPEFLGDAAGAVKDTFTPTGIGTWKRNDTFDDVLAQGGMEEGWTRAGLGFVGDVVTDPTALLVGPLAKGLGAVGKAARAIPAIDNTATAIGDAGRAAKSLLGVKSVAPQFIDNIPTSATKGLSYDEMKRLGDSAQRAAREGGEAQALEFFKGVKGSTVKDLLYAQDEGRVAKDALSQSLQPKWQSKMDELWQKQLELGHVDPADYRKGYVEYQTKSGRPAEVIAGSATQALPSSALKREKFTSLDAAVKFGGATDDPVELLSHSIAKVDKALAADEFVRSVAHAFGSEAPKAGYRAMNLGNMKIGKSLAKDVGGYHLPTQIADDLERSVKLWEEPDALQGFYTNAMKIWKSMATAVNPAHHVVNGLGNIHNMYISGMTFPQMAKWVPKAAKVAMTKDMATMPAVGGHSSAELWKLANKYEIIGTSHQLGETIAKGTLEKVANNPAFRMGRRIGTEYFEEPSRLALWLSEIEKGSSPAKAALRVKDVLFDYSEISKGEKTIRDSGVIPFYTWMRKNIPLQLGMIKEHPERVGRVYRAMEVPWNAEQSKVDQTVIPERGQNAGYVPSFLSAEGGALAMQRLPFPMYDLNKLTDFGAAADMLGPIPKTVIEGITGNKFFGGKVDKPAGVTSASTAAALLSPLNYLLPDSMEGVITPKEIGGRQMQSDRAAWLMNNLIPTGVYGSTARMSLGEDPTQPQIEKWNHALAARLLGMSPDVISPMDQQFEAKDRIAEWQRHHMQKMLLER